MIYRADGELMQGDDWQEPDTLTLAVGFDGRQIEGSDGTFGAERFLLLLNGHHEPVDMTVPGPEATWHVVLTTDVPSDDDSVAAGTALTLRDRCVVLLQRAEGTVHA